MKSEYDFSKAKKNPYIEKITKIINTDKTLTAKNKKSDTNTANE